MAQKYERRPQRTATSTLGLFKQLATAWIA